MTTPSTTTPQQHTLSQTLCCNAPFLVPRAAHTSRVNRIPPTSDLTRRAPSNPLNNIVRRTLLEDGCGHCDARQCSPHACRRCTRPPLNVQHRPGKHHRQLHDGRLPLASGQVNLILPLFDPPLAPNRQRNIDDVRLKPVRVFLRESFFDGHRKVVARDDDGQLVHEHTV